MNYHLLDRLPLDLRFTIYSRVYLNKKEICFTNTAGHSFQKKKELILKKPQKSLPLNGSLF